MTILKGLDDRQVGHSCTLFQQVPRSPSLSILGSVGAMRSLTSHCLLDNCTSPLLVCITGGWGLGRLLDLDHRVLVVLDLRHGVQKNFLAREEH